jgi:hypothetical protein
MQPEHSIPDIIREFLINSRGPFVSGQQQEYRSKEGSLHFLKERHLAQYHLYLIGYESVKGKSLDGLCLLGQDASGRWRPHSGLFGGEGSFQSEEHQESTQPWVSLRTGISFRRKDSFWLWWAGGRVQSQGVDVARVRLIDTHQREVEDQVEDDLVLFLAEYLIEKPVMALFYDHVGNVVGKQQILPANN